MKTLKLRSKRVAVPTIAAVAVLGVGATVWSATASDDPSGSERERVADAAVQAVGGTVVDVETSDDLGEAYEVEVRLDDGTETEVTLDRDLKVLSEEVEDDGRSGDCDDDGDDDRERALSASERAAVEEAALSAVGGGTVLDVKAGDDRGEAYEVELRDADDIEWDVELDADYQVLSRTADD